MRQEEPNKYVKELTQEKYKYGFTTDVHTDVIEKGLNEDIIRFMTIKVEEFAGSKEEVAAEAAN